MRKRGQEEQESQGSVTETVLVLQVGGSLGAYECGVYKAFAKQLFILPCGQWWNICLSVLTDPDLQRPN